MHSHGISLSKPIVISILALGASASQAALTVYSTQASFMAAVSNAGVDNFTGLSVVAPTAPPLVRTAGTYGYTATAGGNDFFGAGTVGNPWLSTSRATDSITFSAFTGGTVSAIGGNFFGTNIDGLFSSGDVRLVATDASGASFTQTITGATSGSFVGFTSNSTITSLVVSAVQPTAGSLWPTVDNLTLAAAVPEPETYALMLAGMGILAFLKRRRG